MKKRLQTFDKTLPNFAMIICRLSNFNTYLNVSKQDILQYGLHNKPKSIKIIAKAPFKSIFRRIFVYSYFAFDNVF